MRKWPWGASRQQFEKQKVFVASFKARYYPSMPKGWGKSRKVRITGNTADPNLGRLLSENNSVLFLSFSLFLSFFLSFLLIIHHYNDHTKLSWSTEYSWSYYGDPTFNSRPDGLIFWNFLRYIQSFKANCGVVCFFHIPSRSIFTIIIPFHSVAFAVNLELWRTTIL